MFWRVCFCMIVIICGVFPSIIRRGWICLRFIVIVMIVDCLIDWFDWYVMCVVIVVLLFIVEETYLFIVTQLIVVIYYLYSAHTHWFDVIFDYYCLFTLLIFNVIW